MHKKKVVGRNSGDRNEFFLSIHGDILFFFLKMTFVHVPYYLSDFSNEH